MHDKIVYSGSADYKPITVRAPRPDTYCHQRLHSNLRVPTTTMGDPVITVVHGVHTGSGIKDRGPMKFTDRLLHFYNMDSPDCHMLLARPTPPKDLIMSANSP